MDLTPKDHWFST